MPNLTSLFLLNAFDQDCWWAIYNTGRVNKSTGRWHKRWSWLWYHLFTVSSKCEVPGGTKGAFIKSPEEQKNGYTIPAELTELLGYPHREIKQKSGREAQQDDAAGKSGCSKPDDLSLISRTQQMEGENWLHKLSSDFHGICAPTHPHRGNKYFLKLGTEKSLEILFGKHFVVNIYVSFPLFWIWWCTACCYNYQGH